MPQTQTQTQTASGNAGKRKRGGQTRYTDALANAILRRLSQGETLRGICRDDGYPPAPTVHEWVADDREGFAERYARARRIGYLLMADELCEIADDGTQDWVLRDGETVVDHEHIQRSRLRVDTRKWLLAKALPKIYGDKAETVHKLDASAVFLDVWKAISAGQVRVIDHE